MTIQPDTQVSSEAIAYQKGSPLYTALCERLSDFLGREQRFQREDHFHALGLDTLIYDHTGVKVHFRYSSDSFCIDAAVNPPVLDLNSPLLSDWREIYGFTEYDLVPMLKTFKDLQARDASLRSMIDLKNGKVSGLFSKIPCDLYLGAGLWRYCKLDNEELAAIILHEVGHIFTMFEAFLYVGTTNMALATAQRALSHLDDNVHRLQLVQAMGETMGVKFANPEKLADPATSAQAFSLIAIRATMDPNLRSSTGAWEYELRSSEFLADQFCARNGGGRAIITGLDKMDRTFDPAYRRWNLTVWLSRLCELLIAVVAAVTIVTLTPLMIFGILYSLMYAAYLFNSSSELSAYDHPSERYARIRQDLIQTLKRRDLDPADRQQIQHDIELLDKCRAGIEEHMSLAQWLWRNLTSSRRRQLNEMQFQQELEKYVNNDMFLHASRLTSLA